ncbi:UbiA family prenyltransferase [bacterium]|nr:UbiA family prenyltransferase [bacterium]
MQVFYMKFLKIYRIQNWWYFLGLPILGALATNNILNPKILIIVSSLLAFAYSWNDYFDYKKYQNGSILVPLLPFSVAILLTLLLKENKRLISWAFLIIVTWYSMPPIRLKRYPLICTLCNAIGFSLLFLLGTTEITKEVTTIYLYIFFLIIVAQLLHELAHIPEDKSQNIKTTANFYGEKKTHFLIFTFFILAIITSVFISYFIFISSLIAGFNLKRIFYKRKDYHYLRKIFRWHGLILGGILALYFLLFLH